MIILSYLGTLSFGVLLGLVLTCAIVSGKRNEMCADCQLKVVENEL